MSKSLVANPPYVLTHVNYGLLSVASWPAYWQSPLAQSLNYTEVDKTTKVFKVVTGVLSIDSQDTVTLKSSSGIF